MLLYLSQRVNVDAIIAGVSWPFRNRFLPLTNFKSLPFLFFYETGIPEFRNRIRPIAASARRALNRSHDCNWEESTFVLTNETEV